MRYQAVRPARFLSRPNRFIAQVELDGLQETVHVKNTGRCRELLIPGRTVYLEQSANPARKTRFDLIAVDKDGLLINMDAQAPNRVFGEWARVGQFRQNLTLLRPETPWGASRFDFYWEDASGARGFVEVKGCTLEEGGLAMFPDAPTLRGVKHLQELACAQGEGYQCAVCIVIQMEGCRCFCPNERTHPEFGQALRAAAAAGVQVLAMDCQVEPGRLEIRRPVPVCLTMAEALSSFS